MQHKEQRRTASVRVRTLISAMMLAGLAAAGPAQAVQTVYAGTTWDVTTSTIDYYVNNYGTTNSTGSIVLAADGFRCVGFVDCANIDNQSGAVWNNSARLTLTYGSYTTWGVTYETGQLRNRGTFNNGALGFLVNESYLENWGTFNNNGGTLRSKKHLYNYGTLNGFSGSEFTNSSYFYNIGTFTSHLGANFVSTLWFVNSGTFSNGGNALNDGALNSTGTIQNSGILQNNDILWNSGTIRNSGTLSNLGNIANGSGSTLVNAGSGVVKNASSLTFNAGSGMSNQGKFSNSGTVSANGTLANSGSFVNGGTVSNGGSLSNSGSFTNTGTVQGAGSFTQSAGTTVNNGAMSESSFNFTGGTISGTGTFSGAMSIGQGVTVAPGNSTGTLTFAGTLASSGNYSFEIAGTTAGLYDVLLVKGGASISGGTLTLAFLSGFTPTAGSSWTFLRASSISGWDTLAIEVTGLASDLDWSIVRDGGTVSVALLSAVPEPAHWPMLLLGLAAVAFWRRRQAAAALDRLK